MGDARAPGILPDQRASSPALLVPRASSPASFSPAPHTSPADFALGVDRSLSGRAWRMREVDGEILRSFELAGYGVPIAQLLAARGVTPDDAGQFLDPRLRDLLPDPHSLANMELAAGRFSDAIRRREIIAVLA